MEGKTNSDVSYNTNIKAKKIFGRLSYFFSALTIAAVGRAANKMVEEIRVQFANNPGILEGTVVPDTVNSGDIIKIDYVFDETQTKELSYTIEFYKDYAEEPEEDMSESIEITDDEIERF